MMHGQRNIKLQTLLFIYCAFVGPNNKLYIMRGTYIQVVDPFKC